VQSNDVGLAAAIAFYADMIKEDRNMSQPLDKYHLSM